MTTVKEFKAQKKLEREQEFLVKYPNGRFTINSETYQIFSEKELSWVKTLPSNMNYPDGFCFSQRAYHAGVDTTNRPSDSVRKGSDLWQNNLFGKKKHFDNLAELINYARSQGCSEELIGAFEQEPRW